MAIELNWALCSYRGGDGHQVIREEPERPATLDYLTRVARAAEEAGFVNILVPTGTHCMDPWATSSAISSNTRKIKFLVAFRPGLVGPTLAAQQINTFDRLTGGRLSLNVVSGVSSVDLKRYGYFADHDERYERNEEFLDILKRLWEESGPVTFKGRFHEVEDAEVFPPREGRRPPDIFLAGASPGARRLAARLGDVHVFHAVEPEVVAEDVREVSALAEEHSRERKLEFGIRHLVCVRETKEEARRAAERIVNESETITTGNWGPASRRESVTQQRVNELAGRGDLWVSDTIYMGVNRVRQGAGTMFVGTPEMVAAQIREYADIGVTRFIMHGWPHLEEAEIFGREVMPLLQDLSLVRLQEPELEQSIS
jgi:alkanesulfonate monooxygenase